MENGIELILRSYSSFENFVNETSLTELSKTPFELNHLGIRMYGDLLHRLPHRVYR